MCVQGGGTGDDWVFVCGESGVHLVREGRSGTIPYIPYHTIPYPHIPAVVFTKARNRETWSLL